MSCHKQHNNNNNSEQNNTLFSEIFNIDKFKLLDLKKLSNKNFVLLLEIVLTLFLPILFFVSLFIIL